MHLEDCALSSDCFDEYKARIFSYPDRKTTRSLLTIARRIQTVLSREFPAVCECTCVKYRVDALDVGHPPTQLGIIGV